MSWVSMRQVGDQTASVLLRESSQKSVTCCRGLFRSSRNLFSTCNTSHLPRELVRIAAQTCIILIVKCWKICLKRNKSDSRTAFFDYQALGRGLVHTIFIKVRQKSFIIWYWIGSIFLEGSKTPLKTVFAYFHTFT